MSAQTMARQDLHEIIDTLSDNAFEKLASYAVSLKCEDMPVLIGPMNAETREALEELRAGKGKRFDSVDELMADLNEENDD
ncbi:MAG: hypothetical protein LBU13_11035 [Synergistaceae bacterium]|jgi:cytochrome c553|nr:hypothetical protein [Synergistaceae bacterium]